MTESLGKTPRLGRSRVTSQGELSHTAISLFLERGFDHTFVDDIAAAAGISRRTFFRYFASKNDIPLGDFDELIAQMRDRLASMDRGLPLDAALRQAIVDLNHYPEDELPHHRNRMDLLLNVPSLAAHSTLRYAAWREVVAEYVAERRGESAEDLAPQAIAWACLGLCMSAYQQWLAHEDADLVELLNEAFTAAQSVFGAYGTFTGSP